jgi:hypothetical protein
MDFTKRIISTYEDGRVREEVMKPHQRDLDKQVADMMWIIRLLRTTVGAPLTKKMVYEKQKAIYGYAREDVSLIVEEIEHRGVRWKQHYAGVPDACILVFPDDPKRHATSRRIGGIASGGEAIFA